MDPDELGEFDRELVLQLREIGVADAYPGEYGFRGSVVGGHDEDGNRIQVSTNEQDVVGDSEFVRSGEISGVPVEYRRFGSAVDTLMFRCAGTHYDVRKYDGPESGRVDLEATEALVQRLITSIGCS